MSGAAAKQRPPPDWQLGMPLPKGNPEGLSAAVDEFAPTDVSARGMKAATVIVNAGAPLIIEFVGGIPAAGKTTIARALEKRLLDDGHRVEILDGDVVRTHLTKDLGFSREGSPSV